MFHGFGQVPLTPEQYQDMRLQKEMWERNRPLTDEELDAMLPSEKEGYKVNALCRRCHACFFTSWMLFWVIRMLQSVMSTNLLEGYWIPHPNALSP